MTVNDVKTKLNDHIGNRVQIRYNLGRNKYEKYDAIIKEVYNYVFVVTLNNDDNPERKSFSYSDIITKIIKIEY